MRSLIKPTLIVVFGLLIFFGARLLLAPSKAEFTQETSRIKQSETRGTKDTLAQETYVSEVIISAPWADTNLAYGGRESPSGEFGYAIVDQRFVGPSGFAVAPNGDIYIADQFNDRIQRFNSEGDFISSIPISGGIVDMCIDRDDNLYLLKYGYRADWEKVSEHTVGRVVKCDQTGNVLRIYPVFTGVAATANFVYRDKSGRIFMACPGLGPYQVGTSEETFSLEQQESSEMDGFLGSNSAPLDENLYFQASPMSKAPHNRFFRYYAVSFDGDTVHVYESSKGIRGSFFGCDEELNIYVGSHSGMRKYNLNGDLVAGWKFGCEKPYFEVYDFGGSRGRLLDEKGNLYVLCYSESEEGGIKVIKWYRQE
ncbi:MAG: hypothetical protein JSV10_09550 [Candidatus Zixiibacteriota bacterium]|nr:MAG: hypothetical protein JSV10_09550 [candidate division Zixibacteria bacterium]